MHQNGINHRVVAKNGSPKKGRRAFACWSWWCGRDARQAEIFSGCQSSFLPVFGNRGSFSGNGLALAGRCSGVSGTRGMERLSHAARAPLLESEPSVPCSWAKPWWRLFLCSAFAHAALPASPNSPHLAPKQTPCHPDAVPLGCCVSVLGSCRWDEPHWTTAGLGLCLQPTDGK